MPPSPFVKDSYTHDPPQQKNYRETVIELIRDECWPRAYRRISKAPEQAQTKTLINLDGQSTKAYPLHYLCRKKNVPVTLVQAFVDACPEAVRTGDSVLGSTPLIVACEHDASVAVLNILVRAYPEGLSMADKDGNLPIHYACSLESPEAAKFLLKACPETLTIKNNKEQTLLHLACSRYDVSVELVKELIRLNEGACKTRDWQERLPLHSACMWKANTEVIEALLKCYPRAIRAKDSHHMTPYDICRKVGHLNHHDSTVKLLRSYQKKQGGLFARGRDVMKFQAENLSESLSGVHSHHHEPFCNVQAD